MAATGGSSHQWSQLIQPLVAYSTFDYDSKEYVRILKFISSSTEYLTEHDAKFDPFYSGLVGLSVNYLIHNYHKAPNGLDLQPALKSLFKFLIAKLRSNAARTLSIAHIVGLIRSLCTANPSDSNELTTFASFLKSAPLPQYILDDREEHLDNDDPQNSSSAVNIGHGDFLSKLSTYSLEVEHVSDMEDREMYSKQQLIQLSSQIFMDCGGPSCLVACLQSLAYLVKYRESLTNVMSGGELLVPLGQSDCTTFKSGLSAFMSHFKIVGRVVTNPALFSLYDQTTLKEVVYTALASLYVGCYSVLCSGLMTCQNSDYDLAMSSIATKSVEVLMELTKVLRQSPRIPKFILPNLHTMSAWLIFRTIDSLTSRSHPVATGMVTMGDNSKVWGLAAHTLVLEGLGSLLFVAKESLPSQTPTMAPAKSTSGRLHEAQKFNMSQFDMLSEYTYQELFRFIPSGSSLRLAGLLFSTVLALATKYKSLVDSAKRKEKKTAADKKQTADVQENKEQTAAANGQIATAAVTSPVTMRLSAPSTPAADDDSLDSLTGIPQLFREDSIVKDEKPAAASSDPKSTIASTPSSSSSNCTWIDSATSFVIFIDKYLISSTPMKAYLCGELCQTRSQTSLSMLALVLKSTTDGVSDDGDDNLTKYCAVVKRLCKHMVTNEILDRASLENFLLMIDLYPDNLTGWPVFAHRNALSVLLVCVLTWQSKPEWINTEAVVVEMWKHFLDSILSECLTANHDSRETEDVNIEHCQTMLALLYTLSPSSKQQVFASLAKTIMAALDIPSHQMVTMVPLPITRLFLLLEFMISYMTAPPASLLEQIKLNILSDDGPSSLFMVEGSLEQKYMKLTKDVKASEYCPVFYKLCADLEGQPVDDIIKSVMTNAEEYDLDMSDFYTRCLNAMLVGSSLDKAKKPDQMTALDCCAIHYHIQVVWQVLAVLPPPPAFLLQMTDVGTLRTQTAALQALRLAPKLKNPQYVEWYKSTLKGNLEQEEIDGLLQAAISRTRSPSFEVQIALHLIQAQMATLRFASENEVISPDLLPGFYSIVTLDAVLTETYALLDMHYKNLKLLSSEKTASPDYEEAKVMELKRCAEDLMPALVLLLGSFTQFVRSSMLYEMSPNTEVMSVYSTLLSISTAPDDTSSLYTAQVTEMADIINNWKAAKFSRFPAPRSWLSDLDNMTADKIAEKVTDQIISGHCETISDSAPKWSTAISLRHLHMTLTRITCDLNSWFPALGSSEELPRTMVPLLFDVSCGANIKSDIVSCLNKAIGQTKVTEVKYAYLLRHWHSIMLNLHDMSQHLSHKTISQLIQTMSFFIQSCLEDRNTSQWLTDLYTTKADLADILIITGSPGCPDIMSINRVLKIFTKLIELVEADGSAVHRKLLESLNKLSKINDQVLCGWLQQIIMASPSESDNGEVEGQVDKNAGLLQTIASYMVKESSVIDKSVPKVILQCLIEVATEVLHQTHNSQGFQELMLIMSTLSKEGDIMRLISAVVRWLDSCVDKLQSEKYLTKHTLYIELANCLLTYINDVMSIAGSKVGVYGGWMADSNATAATYEDDGDDDSNELLANQNDSDAIDNQLCTFTETQRDFKQQHWYYCYTCKMVESVGVCTVCVKVCHKDHDVSYAKYGSFFCDCGAKEDRSCQATTKRTSNTIPAAVFSSQSSPSSATWSDAESAQSRQQSVERQRASLLSLQQFPKERILALLDLAKLKTVVSRLLQTLESEYTSRYSKAMPQESYGAVRELLHQLRSKEKDSDVTDQLMTHTMSFPESTFDNIKPNYSGEQGTAIKQLISSHMIRRQIMCKVTTPGADKPLMVVANDKGKITTVQVSSIFKNMENNKKRPLARSSNQAVPFTILSMSASPYEDGLLAVTGLKECHVLCLTASGGVAKSYPLQPALDTGNFIVKAQWLPGSQSSLAIVTADFIKIYCLQSDVISPQYYYLLPAGKVRDVTFCLDTTTGLNTILVMSSSGHIYTQILTSDSQAVHGSFYITNVLDISHPDITSSGRVVLGGGTSIYYSHALGILMLSYMQGHTFACSLSLKDLTISQISKVILARGKANNSQPMVAWSEAYGHPGLLFCITQSTNNPLALYVSPETISIQEVKLVSAPKSASNKANKVLDYFVMLYQGQNNKNVTSVLLLCEDGSLKVFVSNENHINLWTQPSLNPQSPFSAHKLVKKKQTTKRNVTPVVQLPVDFFELCEQTNDIEYGGNDMLEIYNKNQIKQRLATSTQYIASTKPESFKIEIKNTVSCHVLVGVRILVGSHQTNRIPRYVEIFGRTKTIVADCPKWVDFPFSREECLQAADKIILTFGSSQNIDHVTFIDSIKVYYKPKEAVGWTEEAAVSAGRSSTASNSNTRPLQPSNDDHDTDETVGIDTEEIYAPLAVTATDRLLSSALSVMHSYISIKPDTESEKSAVEASVIKLICMLPPSCVAQSALLLLQSLSSKRSDVHRRMDEARVEAIKQWLSLPDEQIDPRTYQLILEWVRHLGHSKIGSNLHFIAKCYDNPEGYEKKFLTRLVQLFKYLYGSRPPHPMFSLACTPGLQNIRATVCALVDVMFLFTSFDLKDVTSFVTGLCLDLLFDKDTSIRFACKQAMIRVLKPRSKIISSKSTSTDLDKRPDPSPVTVQSSQAESRRSPEQPAPVPIQLPEAANALDAQDADLQDWLVQDPIEPAMMDDLELAIALSLQEQDDNAGDQDNMENDEDEDDEEEDEDDDDMYQQDADYQPIVQEAEDGQEAVLMVGGDSDTEDTPAHLIPVSVTEPLMITEMDSDGGQLSAHSSTEGVQSVGLICPPRSDSVNILPSVVGIESDERHKKSLRALVRQEMMARGLSVLDNSDGMMAIPYLQVLHILLTDLDTEEDQQKLEACLQMLLDQLIDLRRGPQEFVKRTNASEVELIVLRLFSVLMSRSHSSGSSSTSGSRLNISSASVLLKANAAGLFLPILKQLLDFWKVYNPESETSGTQFHYITSSILKNDMSPFFLRQYVKEHPLDVFEVFPQLQTEMILRLINQMKKISDSSSEITSLTFNEDWTRVLSEYLGVCEAAFIKRQVRKLLNYICGTKENYRRVRDANTISLKMSAVLEAAKDCGVMEQVAIAGSSSTLPYITLTCMVENLKAIQDIAASRCLNWQQYCVSNPGTLEMLINLAVQVQDCMADIIITLIRHAITKPNAKSENVQVSDDDPVLHKQLSLELLYKVKKDLLLNFLKVFLLQSNQSSVRELMHSLFLKIYENSQLQDQKQVLKLLWPHWHCLPQYGKKADRYVDLVGYIIINTRLPAESKTSFINGVVDLLKSSNSQLNAHPNANIYNLLQELVDLDGYYLEREPCITCNNPEIPLTNLKLNNIKVDNKFTTTTQMIKLIGSHLITRIHMRITDIKKSKMVKTLTIYYSNRTVQSAVELKNRVGIWQQAKKVNLSSAQSEIKIDFTVPIAASNLMIEYNDFYENNTTSQETLPCPRCSATVPANPGICVNCGENVFQCHKCRSINYDERDPFLCNTCGFCKYAKFEVTLTARPCSAVDPITNEEDRTKTINSVNTLLEKADRTYGDIQTTRSTLERLLTQLSGASSEPLTISANVSGHVNKYIQQVAIKYCEEARKQFEDLSKSMQKVIMSRQELLQFDKLQSRPSAVAETPSSTSAVASQAYINEQMRLEAEQNEERINRRLRSIQQSSSSCYGCLAATISHCLSLLHAIATQPFAKFEHDLIEELVTHNLNSGSIAVRRDAMSFLCTLTKGNREATRILDDMLYDRVEEAMNYSTSAASLAMNIRSEMSMLARSVESDPESWEHRIKTVIKLYCKSVKTKKSHVIEAVALTCLEIIKSQIVCSKPASQKYKDKDMQTIANMRVDGSKLHMDLQKWLNGEKGYSYSDWIRDIKSQKASKHQQSSQAKDSLQRKYFTLWRNAVKHYKRLSAVEVNDNSWLSSMLFNPASQNSREISAEIVETLSSVPGRILLLIEYLTKLLPKVPTAGPNASAFITLYKKLIQSDEIKYHLVIKHNILVKLADIVASEIDGLSTLEDTKLGTDLSLGWGLQALVSIIKMFVENEVIRHKYKSKLVGTVLDGYLSLRKLVVQRTKMVESTQELLLGLLEQLTSGTEAETKEFMSICIQTVSKYSPTDLRSPVFIFERLCSIIRPEETEASEFLIILEKDPQQEDFLQGRMSGNPYISKEPGMGPLMRDIKNKICTDCELVALLEDDSGMELLVNNKIISLDLKVADVYKKVWQPARENEPMRIVYRMRGLLGDATEDMVNSLKSKETEEEDGEVVYRMAVVMQQCGGLDVMLKRLGYVRDYQKGKQLVNVLLKLFEFCLKLKVNRTELIKPEKDTISVMLRSLNRALRAEQQGMTTQTQGRGLSITEKLLQLMEIVLSEASHLPPEQYTEFTKMCGDSDQLMLLLDRINSPFVRSNPSVLEALMRLIPFLACGEREKMSTLIEHFKPYLNFLQFDNKHTDNEVTYLECFCVIVSGIKENANGSRLKQMIIDSRIMTDAIDYITVLAPPIKTLLATDADDWKDFVGKPCLPYVLRLLTGLCSGHSPSQEIVGESMIPILHKLEHMSSNTQIGSLAENLMEVLCQNEKVSKQITQIRAQTKAEKKRLAMAVREKQLQSIGMKTNKRGQVVTTSPVMKEAESLKEEMGLICSICREGYHNQPNKVLAVYTFTKRANIEDFEIRSRKMQGLFTVSHMNIVHLEMDYFSDCHCAAVRLASGRDEWESAALHNANARCNGLLPLWGPLVSETSFSAALAKHNTYLRESTDLRSDTYMLTVVHDIKLLLLRFANEQPFSTDGGGGGRNSNMLLVPYELLIALFTISSQGLAKQKETNLQSYLDAAKDKHVASSYEVEGPVYWLVMSLVLWSRDTWKANRLRHLERLLILAQSRKVSPSGTNTLSDKSLKEYAVYKPMLVLFGLVSFFYDTMFKSVPQNGDWIQAMMTYIRNSDMQLTEASDKIVSNYESELLPCDGLQEMFDVLGLLSEVPNPDEWLTNILTSL